MKRLIIIAILLFPVYALCQRVTVKHKYYTTVFDEKKHIPFVVSYTLTKQMLSCGKAIPRNTAFKPDPRLPAETALSKDYAGHEDAYDKGHNMPAEDNACNVQGMDECFYCSNIFPQTPKLNRGVWKTLEIKERLLALDSGSIRVFIGSYGEIETLGPDAVVAPAYCWKVIYVNGKYEAYTFPNTTTVEGPIAGYITTIDEIEQKSGYHFSRN